MAARGMGLVIINVTTPNLMFSTIVPSFNSSNITELGPLVLVALIYMLIGMTLSWIIKQLFWVPHRFRHGILVAGGWANIGDVPISVALSIMASAPFNGTDDENLAVTLFPLGGHRPPEQEEIGVLTLTNEHLLSYRVSGSYFSLTYIRTARLPDSITGHIAVTHTHWFHKFISLTFGFLRSLLAPPSLSIIISFIIAITPPLKALFVPGVPGTHISSAPDGQPPLALIMKTATFISGASVPMGLITLGSALARLSIPRNQWSSLPLGAIGSLAVGRLVVMPVLGILICQQFTRIGLIDPSNNVLRFICILLSGLPTATTQPSLPSHFIFSLDDAPGAGMYGSRYVRV
ncbi:uncharacterized protein BJ212DRAFT_1300462 [Suillus subaureus]|uniref:Auxin efflux carrier n=1 Tax=Suillus subaureus TaxID=48587 RepID=A0A9P7E8Z0_9AGAM|nr:uncharacterized protein BJ212DRAFT_1300462 [Suillus subaureus]KAG1814665.1 hypothetical protein BJ212DRAFT_1300462 [Suillus subaureus]